MGRSSKAVAAPQLLHAEEKGEKLRQACLEAADGDELIFIDGHDDAIIGIADVNGELRVVYGQGAIVRKLMARDGMDRLGAAEFVDYNIVGVIRDGFSPVVVQIIRP